MILTDSEANASDKKRIVTGTTLRETISKSGEQKERKSDKKPD